jgi:hypothetical protein
LTTTGSTLKWRPLAPIPSAWDAACIAAPEKFESLTARARQSVRRLADNQLIKTGGKHNMKKRLFAIVPDRSEFFATSA